MGSLMAALPSATILRTTSPGDDAPCVAQPNQLRRRVNPNLPLLSPDPSIRRALGITALTFSTTKHNVLVLSLVYEEAPVRPLCYELINDIFLISDEF
jgi:hypothetical protein